MMNARILRFALMAAVALTLVLWGLQQVAIIQKFEYGMLDWRLKLRQKHSPQPVDPRLFFVSIDNETTQKLGAWPFSRSYHAQLISWLQEEKPGAIVWDILFTERKDRQAGVDAPLGEEDNLLVEAVKTAPTFISASARDETGQRKLPPSERLGPTKPLTQIQGPTKHLIRYPWAQVPFEPLIQYSRFGFADCEPGVGGRRKLPLIVEIDGQVFPSLVLQTLLTYFGVAENLVQVKVGEAVTVPIPNQAPLRIPIDESGSMLINFRAILADIPQMSYWALAGEFQAKHVPQEGQGAPKIPPLQNKMVMLGFSGTGFDTGSTPLEENSPLVIFHLNALNNILRGDYLRETPLLLWLGGFAVIAFALGLLMLALNVYAAVAVAVLSITALVGAGWGALLWGNLWVPLFLPTLGVFLLFAAVMAYRFFGEEREKVTVRKALGSYLSQNVLEEVLADPHNVKLGGTKRDITVMFCDIRGFTKYCETRDPEGVVAVLNEYLNLMTEVIIKYDGTLDKYIGDCIMAFWGAPKDQPDHAQRAVCCAMEMRYALGAYKTQRAGLDQEIFECGIGIHSGEALVGRLGSERLLNYTAIGSTVNLAARLEALTKTFTCRIIISEATRQRIQGEFTMTELGDVLVPGFSVKTKLYSVEAMQDITSALQVGKTLAQKQAYTAEEVTEPVWQPAPLPEDAEE